jgi:hypothetical protein
MSLLAIAFATAGAGDVTTSTPEPLLEQAPFTQAIDIAIPSLDTGRGISGGYERWFPVRRMSFEILGEVRESASGDYTGLRLGTGFEARWYWRAHKKAWLSVLPANNPVGWFVGNGVYVATDLTHDNLDHRWLGTALEIGSVVRAGYRIAPWRQLTITPSAGLELQRDIDLSGRLSGVWRPGIAFGLDVGWLF